MLPLRRHELEKPAEEIRLQITHMQVATHEAVAAIEGIGTTIASRVEEQGMVTREITLSVAHAAAGTGEVSSNILQVGRGAEKTEEASQHVLAAASEMSREAEQLATKIELFLAEVSLG